MLLVAASQYFDGDLWIEAFEADTTMTESGKTTVVNIYRWRRLCVCLGLSHPTRDC